MIDTHIMTATIDGVPVEIVDGTLTLDRGWSPYVQARLTVRQPADIMLLDPRQARRVKLTFNRRYSSSRTIGYVSARDRGKTIGAQSAQYAGRTLDEVSRQYREAWNGPTGRAGVDPTLTVSAYLTGSTRRRSDRTLWDIAIDGEEWRAQGWALSTGVFTPAQIKIGGLCNEALGNAQIANLADTGPSVLIPRDDDGSGPEWLAGVTVWDYLNPIVQAAGLRLYADEAGIWRIEWEEATHGTLTLRDEVIDVTDTWATTGRYYDAAVLVYEWETEDGVRKRQIDAYRDGNLSTYVEHVEGRMTQAGRAQKIVERGKKRALAQVWELVADYRVRPGMLVTTPDGVRGLVDAVSFEYPAAQMTVTVIDVVTAVPPVTA